MFSYEIFSTRIFSNLRYAHILPFDLIMYRRIAVTPSLP